MNDSPSHAGVSGFVRRLVDDHTPDAELHRRYVSSQDESAFAAIVRRHGPAVWRVCRTLVRQNSDAEDAFQATFLLLVRNAVKVRNANSIGAWLYGTAVKVATRSRAKRRPEQLEIEPSITLADLTVKEAEVLFHEELAKLPDKFRGPLVLCCLDGLSRDEAAKQLGVTLEAVKHGLERGREMLKARLIKRGVVMSVPLLAGWLTPQAMAAPLFELTAVSASAVSLATEVSKMTVLTTWKLTIAAGLVAITVVGGVALVASDFPREQFSKDTKAIPVEKRVKEIVLPNPILRATTSGDGKVLATVTEKEREGAKFAIVTFWNTVTGKQLGTLGEIKNDNPYNIALSPDGSAFAWIHRVNVLVNDIEIQVFDTRTGELRCVAGRESVLSTGYPDLQFSPDGKRIAIKSDMLPPIANPAMTGGVVVSDADTGKQVQQLFGHIGRGGFPVFIDDGQKLLTVGMSDSKAIVWNVESGKQIRTFELTDSVQVKTNAVTPDGKTLITFHDNGEIKAWNVETGKHAKTMAEPGDEILHSGAVSISKDGKRVAAVVQFQNKVKLKVWDLKSGKLLLTKGIYGPQTVSFDDAGRVAVCDGNLSKIVFYTIPE